MKGWSVQTVKPRSDKWKTGWIRQVAKNIVVTNVRRYTRLIRNRMAIPKKSDCLRFACMWKAIVMVRLPEFWRSTRKVSPIGLAAILPIYHPPHCHPKWKRRNWMSCTRSSGTKKRNLRSHDSRSRHTLCFELGCGLGAYFWSPASVPGACSASHTVLQRCLSCLRHLVLWRSLWNENR